MEKGTYHYTARVAAKPVQLSLLPGAALRKLVASDQTITQSLVHLLADRTTVFGDRIVGQAYDSVRRRLALLLCELHERYHPEDILLSRNELAQMVGSTKESISRSLTDFKVEGFITTKGRRIAVLNTEALREIEV